MNVAKLRLFTIITLIVVLLVSGCDSKLVDLKVNLDENFSLNIEESALIIEEGIVVKFVDVVEDSRCPRSVICVWEGRVIVVIEILSDGWFQQFRLSQPGLTTESAQELYGEYEITYRIEPYPEKPDGIEVGDYKLFMTFSKN